MMTGISFELAEELTALVVSSRRREMSCVLSAKEEVLLGLIFLRHYPIDSLLGAMFQVPVRSANHIRHRIVNCFYEHFKKELNDLEKQRIERGVVILDLLHTWVIDGSEQPVKKSSDPVTDTRFYSVKKSKHTINIVAVIAVDGFIMWLSRSYPGSVNDREIVKQTRSDWYDKFGEDEWGLGDKGFAGFRGWRFTIPGDPGEELSRQISRYRIRVENKFADIKQWRATREQLRADDNILEEHQKNWVIVSGFLNRRFVFD